MEVEFIDTNYYAVEITCGKKILEGVTTNVDDGKLVITDENRCNFVRDYSKERKMKIYGSPNVIWQHGDGKFYCKNVNQDTLRFYLEGNDSEINFNGNYFTAELYQTGSLKLTGSSDEISIAVNSYGTFYGYDCVSRKSIIRNTGEGDAYVFGLDTLGISISSVGNVYYKQEPYKLILSDIGDGELIKE